MDRMERASKDSIYKDSTPSDFSFGETPTKSPNNSFNAPTTGKNGEVKFASGAEESATTLSYDGMAATALATEMSTKEEEPESLPPLIGASDPVPQGEKGILPTQLANVQESISNGITWVAEKAKAVVSDLDNYFFGEPGTLPAIIPAALPGSAAGRGLASQSKAKPAVKKTPGAAKQPEKNPYSKKPQDVGPFLISPF
jgi:hypothetical protein